MLAKEGVIALQNTTSCGVSTRVSVPCMFSHISRNEFAQKQAEYEFLPKVLAKKGVSVLYKDNNFGGCFGTCKGTFHTSTVHDKHQKFCSTGECVDGILLEGLDDYIKQNQNNNIFIVLHQNGSHGPRYNKRYPLDFEVFKPTCNNNDVSKCSQEELVNAYDNTILYADFIIYSAIQIDKKSNIPSAVIYVSDHGESLGENGIYLHGFPYFIAPKEQKEIPFIIWMSDDFKKGKNFEQKQSYSHDNIFHSILGAFGVKTKLYDKNLDIFPKNTSQE
jgi:lipid A ethanolaminephosphotransferase